MNPEKYIGCDESGRGNLAGPLIVAAYYTSGPLVKGVADSKKLSKMQISSVAHSLRCTSGKHALSIWGPEEIDLFGIQRCWELGVREVIAQMVVYNGVHRVKQVILDGNISVWGAKAVPKADDRFYNVSAASILAKDQLNRYMAALDMAWPIFNWKQNCGYGTAEHLKTMNLAGVTEWHRYSYAPVSRLGKRKVDIPFNRSAAEKYVFKIGELRQRVGDLLSAGEVSTFLDYCKKLQRKESLFDNQMGYLKKLYDRCIRVASFKVGA